MQCYECIGISESFDADDIFGLEGWGYQRVTSNGRYKRQAMQGATLLTYSCLSNPKRLTCLAKNTKSNLAHLAQLHYVIRTIDQMAELTEKNKMAKFFNCNPEDIVRIE